MPSQVLFGKGGLNSPQRPAVATAAPVTQPAADEPAMDAKTYYEQINAGTVKSGGSYGAGKSLIIAGLLWFFLGNFGAHRFYLGHYIIGGIQAMLAVFSIYNVFSVIGDAITELGPNATEAQTQAWVLAKADSLGAIFIVIAIFGLWVFFDFIYIIIRKVSSN